MNVKAIVSIDPGASGGIALYVNNKISVMKMYNEIEEFAEYLRFLKKTYGENLLGSIEGVNSWVSDKEDPGKSFGIEKLVRNYNEIVTTFRVLEITIVKISSKGWQYGLNLKFKGDDKKRKEFYKKAAGKYYPEIKPTLWNADALCIMHFTRLKVNTDAQYISDRILNKNKNLLF